MKLADLELSTRAEVPVATLSGEIDMSNAAELQTALSEATPNDAAGLIVDLSSLDYLDSAGIQLLFRLHGALGKRAQQLVLVVPEGSVVAETFRLAGVTGTVTLVRDIESALAALPSEGPPS